MRDNIKKSRFVSFFMLFLLELFLHHAAAGEPAAPLFTDDDLKRYEEKAGHQRSLPGVPLLPEDTVRRVKGMDAIFRENDHAVTAVVAYDEQGKAFSHGTGFVVSADGAVITCYHIISNAVSARVKIGNVVLPVEGVLNSDTEHDVVMLKVGATGLPVMKLGNSHEVRIDDLAYLIATLQGKGNSISEGRVTGKRYVGGKNMIQLSVPFFAGSSGGPVLNYYGEVIGIAAMVIKDARPVSFAVPVEVLKDKSTSGSVIPLKEALYRDRRQGTAYWIAVANSHNASNRHQEAIDAYRRAIDTDPDSAIAHSGLGVVYAGLKRYKEAVNAYQRALALAPDSAWTRSNLGLAYIEMKMFREAVETLQQAITMMPDLSAAHFNLGIAFMKLGQYREAANAYEEAVRLNQAFADAYFGLGMAYKSLHDRQAARRQYETLHRLDPTLAAKLWKEIKE